MDAVISLDETVLLDIELDENTRNMLNVGTYADYDNESKVIQMPYFQYVDTILAKGKAPIALQILRSLFRQYPEFCKIRNDLIISTHRTVIQQTLAGIEGDANFHTDVNANLPVHHDRNLIISWGTATEAFTLKDSERYEQFKRENVELTPSGNVRVKNERHSTEQWVEDNGVATLKSMSPTNEGNIRALVISGKKVYHRRLQPTNLSDHRYLMNIYFRKQPPNMDPSPRCSVFGTRVRGVLRDIRYLCSV